MHLPHSFVPADRPAWKRSFSEIHERNQHLLRGLLETRTGRSSDETRKLGDFLPQTVLPIAVPRSDADVEHRVRRWRAP